MGIVRLLAIQQPGNTHGIYQYAALWGTLRVGIEQQAACPHGTRLHLQNRKLFFRLPSKSDRLLAGEFSRT
jgi:hypothetical protein